ncbi:glycosyltransferase [Macellibacteroides fermentans]|uniref:glycosyltransferase n=1 Tax=Macellibacteroides fermentans TaxID=879969 RepID=UPI00406C4427
MKIVQINSVLGVGSTGRIVLDLYNFVISDKSQAVVAYGRNHGVTFDSSYEISSIWGNYTHGIKTRIFDRHGFGSKVSTKKFIQFLRNYNPDIVHLHNVHGYYLNIEMLFCYLKEMGIPVIWTLHDCWAFTGHCAYFEYIGCNKWKNTCNHCPQKHKYPKSWLMDSSEWNHQRKKHLFKSVDNLTIVTPSEWLGELVKSSCLKEYPIKVINNGIDLNSFSPVGSLQTKNTKQRLKIENKYTVLGVASVWDERKGLRYFHELSERLSNDYRIIVVGVSERQMKQLPNNIIGIKRTHSLKELAELYSIADVFLNPTLEDNFPTTNLEALACGTPVITFKTGGSPEAIDETCGIVVEKGSAEGLVKAIEHIRNSPFSSEACRKRAMIFDKNDKYAEYIKLYEEILAKKA